MSLYDEAILIQKPSGYKAGKLYNVKPSPEVSEQSSVEFDGVDDYLAVDDITFSAGQTISMWINPTELDNYRSLFGKDATSSYVRLIYDSEDKGFEGETDTNGDYFILQSSNVVFVEGEWTHLVLVWNDDQTWTMYCDGIEEATSSATTDNTMTISYFGVGYSSSTFYGKISDVAIFSRALNQSDVKEIYNYGSPNDLLETSFVNDLESYYQMGDGTLDSYPLIADQTDATLGSDLLSGWDFTSGWSIAGASVINDSDSFTTTGSGGIQKTYVTVGNTYQCKLAGSVSNNSIRLGQSSGVPYSSDFTGTFDETFYFTAITNGNLYLRNNAAATTDITTLEVKQIQGNPAMMTNMSSADIVAWTPDLETDFDVARSSWTTRRNASGYIEQVAPNVPRLNYDSDDSCPYLLTEAASTNLITYPKSFGNSYWTKSGASVEGDESSISETFYTSDFSSDTDGFTSVRITGTGNNDNISDGSTSKDNVYKQIAIGGDRTHYGVKTSFLTDGKYYRVKFDYYIPTSNAIVTELSISIRIGTTVQVGKATVTGAWATFDEYIMASGTDLWIAQSGADGASTFDADGDITYITNVIADEYSGYQAPMEKPTVASEELFTTIPDNIFDTDAVDRTAFESVYTWHPSATLNIDVSNNVCTMTSVDGNNRGISFAGLLTVGKQYKVTLNISSAGNYYVGSSSYGSKTSSNSYDLNGLTGSVEAIFMADSTDLRILSKTTDSISLDQSVIQISVKEVTDWSGGGLERDAYKLVESEVVDRHYIVNGGITTSASNVAESIFIKNIDAKRLRITDAAGGNLGILYDFETETVIDSSGSYNIIPLANNWYRFELYGTSAATSRVMVEFVPDDWSTNSNPSDFLGTNRSLYIAYAQLEEQASATSLMLPTTEGSTASRVGDVVINGGSQSLFGGVNASGVLYAEIAANSDDLTERRVALTDGTVTNRVDIQYNTGSNSVSCRLSGSAVTINEVFTLTDITVFNKIAVRWSATNVNVYINGASVFSNSDDYSFTGVTFDGLSLSSDYTSSKYFYGKTKGVAVFNYLSDTEMNKLTTL